MKNNGVQGSEPFLLHASDLKKIVTGALIVSAAAALDYFAEQLMPMLEGNDHWTIPIIAVAINSLRKWLTNTRMIVTTAAVLLILFPSLATAADIVLTDLKPGTHYLKIVVAADGTVQAVPLTTVRVGDTPTTPTDPPTDPPADEFTTFRKTLSDATDKVSDPKKIQAKEALATLYKTTASLPVTSKSQLIQATDTMFNALPLAQQWSEWKSSVDSFAVELDGVDDARKAWQIVAEVLEK